MDGDTYKDKLNQIYQTGVTQGYFVGVITTLLVLSLSILGVPLWLLVGVTLVAAAMGFIGSPVEDVNELIERLDNGDVFVQDIDESVVSLAEAREKYANNEITIEEYEKIAEQALAAEEDDVNLSIDSEPRVYEETRH